MVILLVGWCVITQDDITEGRQEITELLARKRRLSFAKSLKNALDRNLSQFDTACGVRVLDIVDRTLSAPPSRDR